MGVNLGMENVWMIVEIIISRVCNLNKVLLKLYFKTTK